MAMVNRPPVTSFFVDRFLLNKKIHGPVHMDIADEGRRRAFSRLSKRQRYLSRCNPSADNRQHFAGTVPFGLTLKYFRGCTR